MKTIDFQKLESIYRQISGGVDLLEWFGNVPSFHDAEIVSLVLNRRSPSSLTVHGWIIDGTTTEEGTFKLQKKAVVVFKISDIVYLKLDGFSRQNVLGGLNIVQCPPNPEEAPYYCMASNENDYEIILEPCFGLDGIIRCKSVSISFVPGDPTDTEKYARPL
jgi:hypothetical protein